MKKNVLIIILVGIICLGVGFGGSYMFLKQKNKCEEVKCEERQGETKCDAPFEEKVFKEQHTLDYEQLLDKINAMNNLDYLNKNFSIDEIQNLDMMKFALKFIDERYDEEFSIDRVNEITKKYFDKEVKGEDIPCNECEDINLYLYDKDKKTFKYNEMHGGHGSDGRYNPNVLNRIVSIENKENEYTVRVKKAFCIMTGDTGYCTRYYNSYDGAINKKDYLFDIEVDNSDDFMDAIDHYYPEVEFNKISNDKLNTYTYVFEKNGDNDFILKSYSFR